MSGDGKNPAALAQPVEDSVGDGRWLSMHMRFVAESRDCKPDVLFIGDSMVQLMQQFEVWEEFFSPLHAINFGICEDTTCNVLWRLRNGELANIFPKVVIVWVGTFNYNHTADQVAGGIFEIVRLIAKRLPRARIIVMGLLPRGERHNPVREKHTTINYVLRSWVPKIDQAQFLDLGAGFVNLDGTISSKDMFDYLHLTSTAYRLVCKPLSELVKQTLEEIAREQQPLPQ